MVCDEDGHDHDDDDEMMIDNDDGERIPTLSTKDGRSASRHAPQRIKRK
jgi:hypothetical protein